MMPFIDSPIIRQMRTGNDRVERIVGTHKNTD
jgi:hypothetical protein